MYQLKTIIERSDITQPWLLFKHMTEAEVAQTFTQAEINEILMPADNLLKSFTKTKFYLAEFIDNKFVITRHFDSMEDLNEFRLIQAHPIVSTFYSLEKQKRVELGIPEYSYSITVSEV